MAQVPPVCADSEGRPYHELPSLGKGAYLFRLAFKQLLQLLLHFRIQKLKKKKGSDNIATLKISLCTDDSVCKGKSESFV